MPKPWVALAVVLLAACPSKNDDAPKRTPIVREIEIPPPKQPEPPQPAEPAQPAVVDQATRPAVPDAKPECVDQGAVISFDPAKLKACFDTNDDGAADRCVTWRKDGKVASIDTVFDVEDVDAKEAPEPPIEYRSDIANNDDERITLDGSSIEICPYDRTCMRIMPKVDDGEVQTVFTDPDYKRGAFLIKDYEGSKAAVEMWDLAAGRMRARAQLKRLVADETYDLSMHAGSGAVIVIADDSNGRALGSVFGYDGGFRGELGQGSRNLDVGESFQHQGVFGIVDIGPVDGEPKAYVLYLHSLVTGGAIGKFSIKRDDSASGFALHPLDNGFVGFAQWGEQLRIDMIDLRTRSNRVLLAPSC